jgi:hypothetical protein
MTTKPKARKFRIRKTGGAQATSPEGADTSQAPRAQRQPPKATQPHRPAAQRLTHRP